MFRATMCSSSGGQLYEYNFWYDVIYLLTSIGLLPSGSTHLHTNNKQNNTNNNRTTQITTNVEECRPCPVFGSVTLAFALQLRKKHGKTSVRLRKASVRVQYTYCRNTHTLQNQHKNNHSVLVAVWYAGQDGTGCLPEITKMHRTKNIEFMVVYYNLDLMQSVLNF
jgi:hypothetical protein